MFGSFGAGFGSFGGGVGGVLPALTNLTSWLKAPTQDGTTLVNSKGVDAELTDVNCLNLDGNNDHIDLPSVPSDLLQGVFDISFDILVDDSDTSYQRVIWFIDGDAFFRMQKNNGSNTFDFWATAEANVLDIFREQHLAFTPNVEFNFRAVGDGTDVKVYYDDVLQNTTSITAANKQSSFSPTNKSLGKDATSFKGKLANFKMSSGGVLHTHLPIAEGSGTKAYDVSGNGNHGTIDGATWTTEDGIESWNHEYGFDSDIFKGYAGYWDVAASGSGTWVANESNLTLTGNTSISPKFRQTVEGMESGDTLVVSGTAVQTGGAGSFNDLYISSASAGWTQGTVTLGGQAGTYNFSTTLNANSTTCDIQFIALNEANVVISNLKFEVVKKIPALNTKTKQVATFDGVDDYLDTNFQVALSQSVARDMKVKFIISGTGNMDLFSTGSTKNSHGIKLTGARKFIIGVRGDSASCFIEFADGFNPVVNVGDTVEARMQWDGVSTVTATVTNITTGITTTQTKTLSVDGDIATTTSTERLSLSVNTNRTISGSSGKFKGKVLSCSYTEDGVKKLEYDFQNNIGTTTVQDLTANDNDGTATIGTANISTGAGGLAEFWGTRVADNDGVLVSADYATGNTSISNPAGFVHNNSECGVKLQSRTVGTFDGAADYVEIESASGVDLTADANNNLGSCVITATFKYIDNGAAQVIYACGSASYRLFVASSTFRLNSSTNTQITASSGDLYRTTATYNSSGEVTNFVVENLTDDTTDTYSSVVAAASHGGQAGFQIGARTPSTGTTGLFFNGEVRDLSVTSSSVGANFTYNFSEAQGTTLTDLSGNDNNGTLTVGSGGTETFWANSYREYPNVLSSYSFIPSNITVTGLSDANANTTYFLSGYGELISGSGFYWTANNGYFIALDDGGPYWAIYNDIGDELSDNTAAGATLLPAEGSWSNSAVIAHSTQGLFIKTSGTNITQIGQYDEDEVLTATEVTRNERYFG